MGARGQSKTGWACRPSEGRHKPNRLSFSQIDQPGVRVIVDPGGTNKNFDKTHLRKATIVVWGDNATIFNAQVAGKADLMITDSVMVEIVRISISEIWVSAYGAMFCLNPEIFKLRHWLTQLIGWAERSSVRPLPAAVSILTMTWMGAKQQ